MSETFTKLFSSITDSSVWMEDSDTRIVWVTLMAMADQDGYVGSSIPGIAARARVSLDVTEKAMEKFQQPDKYSRSKLYEGRRIAEVERGWLLLNHSALRDERRKEDRKESNREAQAKRRAKLKAQVEAAEAAKNETPKLKRQQKSQQESARVITGHQEYAKSAKEEGEREEERDRDRSTLTRGSESARADGGADVPLPLERIAADLVAANASQAESEIDRSDREHREIRAAVRLGFSKRWEKAGQKGMWTLAGDPAVDKVASWVASLSRDRVEQLADLERTLDTFFADPWVKSAHFPISDLVKRPERYLDPRAVPAPRQSGYAPRGTRVASAPAAPHSAFDNQPDDVSIVLAQLEAEEAARRTAK